MKKLIALFLALCMVISVVPMTLAAEEPMNAIDYFENPDYTAKPMARMWFGDGSSGEDDNDTIAKQINALAAAGFGGVEVTMLADSADYTNEQAGKYGWGSESWVKMIKKVFKAANAVEGGFEVDVTITGHWPATINTIDPNDPGASTEMSYTISKVSAEDIAAGKVTLELPEMKTKDKGTDLGDNDEAPFIFTDTLVNSVLVKVESTEEKEVSSGGGGFPWGPGGPGGGGFPPGGDFPFPMALSVEADEPKETETHYNLDFDSMTVLNAAPNGEGHKAGVPDAATAEANGWDYNAILEFFGPEPTEAAAEGQKMDANGNRYRMADWQDYYGADLPADLTASEGEDIQAGDWVVVSTFYRGTGQLVSGGRDTLMYNRVYAVNYFDHAGIDEVIDYWNEKILDDELRALFKENGSAGIFEDSIEVSGAGSMWTYDMMDEIDAYYGEDYAYADILPTIMGLTKASKYHLVNDEADLASRIQQDYNNLMGNLYEDQHCTPANEFANSIDAQFRAQTYTLTGLDVAGAASTVNIPEGDNSTKGDGLRLLSAAVNLYDKKYLSMEAITASQQYELNWETVLFEVAANFSWGVNRAIFHGTPYSKNLNGYVADWPGWDQFGVAPLIFAEAYSYREPYWEEMYMVGNYVARNQAVLQYGTQKADVVVVRDGTTVSSLGSGNSFQTLLDNGYNYNLMSEALLLGENASKVSNGKIYEDGPGYQAVVLNSVTTMSPDVLDVLLKYAANGIPVICVNSDASKVYGTEKDGYTDAITAAKYDELVAYDCVYEVAAVSEVLGVLQAAGVKPAARYEIPTLETTHYVDETDGTNYYYLYSTGGQTISPGATSGKQYKEKRAGDLDDVIVTLTGEGTPYILDAMTGEVTQATQYTVNGDGTITVCLGDIRCGTSMLVALSENTEDFPAPGAYAQAAENADYDIVRNDDGTLSLRSAVAGTYTLTMGDGQTLNVKVGEDVAAMDLSANQWTMVLESYGPKYDDASEMVDDRGIQTVDPSDTVITTVDLGVVPLGDIKDISVSDEVLTTLGVEKMDHVSGKGYYTTTFDWNGDGAYLDIAYGHDQLTGLVVNGTDVAADQGALNNLTGIVDITDYLVAGENTVTIEITTTLADRAFVESDTFARARRNTNRNGLFGVTLNAYDDVVFYGADVTVELTGDTEALVSDDLTYTVTAAGAEALTTVQLTVSAPAEPAVTAADGWEVLWSAYADGVLTALLINNDGLTGEAAAPIATLILPAAGKDGEVTVTLEDAVLSAYVGDAEAYVSAVLGNASVTTTVDYHTCDVNRDGVVDQLDITRAQRYFGAFDEVCDVTGDGTVDISDLIMILNNYTA